MVVSKIRVSITVEREVYEAVQKYFRKRVQEALDNGETLPKQARIFGELCEGGWKKGIKPKGI